MSIPSWMKKKKAPKFPKTEKLAGRLTIEDMGRRELEKKLDEVFSQYIRQSAAGGSGMVRCITCNKLKLWQEVDNGHYISRALRLTRWDERNCAPQCRYCNSFMEGQKHIFRKYLVEKYGELEVSNMEFESTAFGKTMQIKEWLIERIKYYRAKVKALKCNKIGQDL